MNELIHNLLLFIKNKDNIIIRICGHGASGKTTFANYLCARLEDESYNLLGTDPYIISSNYRKYTFTNDDLNDASQFNTVTACLSAAHELASLERDLKMLKAGMNFLTIDMPWQPAEIIYSNRKITIVEGMSPTFLDTSLFDLSIYIYTDSETELERRLYRDVELRGKDKKRLLESHVHRRKQYDLHMHGRSKDFDVIIDDSNSKFRLIRNPFG